MEAGTGDERRGLSSKASVGHGLISNDQSTLNLRDINYNINNGTAAKQTRTLKASLYFPGMANRERNVATAHEQTGRWLLKTKQYLNWETGVRHIPKSRHCCGLLTDSANISNESWQNRLLWIKGNAGAGKSTLVKMAVEHAKKTYKKALILPHFFNARGNALERSTEGMYRTLLYWILESSQELEARLYSRDLFVELGKWPVPELIRLLEAAMENLHDRIILFYIDALDECDQKDIRGMLGVFRRLVETGWKSGHEVCVCFASRPFPHYTFNHAVYLDMSEQKEHDKDIVKYIEACLNDGITSSIRDQVQKKAAGVFMWVVLVVDMLNDTYDAGHAGKLEELVRSVPAGLYELYGHILERHPGDEDAMLEWFRWLLFSHGFNSADDMWWTMQLSLGLSDEDIRRDFAAQTTADRTRYTLHMGKGLVRFVPVSPNNDLYPAAGFIHESVREFILDKDSAVLRMYGVQSRDALKAQSHQRLRDAWFKEWTARRPQLLKILGTEGRNNITDAVLGQMGWLPVPLWLNPPFPAAFWAPSEMLYQAEDAQICGISQTEFLSMVSQYGGPYLVHFRSSAQLVMGSLPGFLIAHDCPMLIRETQREIARGAIQTRQPFGLMDEGSEWSPVTIAMIYNPRHGSIDSLLELYLESQPRDPRLQQILQHLADNHARLRIIQRPRFGQLLDLSLVDPMLATFFLIALAPTHTLEPHLNPLQQLVENHFHQEHYGIYFSHTLLLFVQAQLQSAAIDIMGKDTMRWLECMERKGRRADERLLCDSDEDSDEGSREGINAREREEMRQRGQTCQQIAALIKARE